MNQSTDIAAAADSRFRHSLAKTILVSSIVGLFSISVAVILGGLFFKEKESNREFLDSAKFVFGAILPLLGAWVGTLLAYYFSKENFEAATRSVTAMAKEIVRGDARLKDILVADIMRPLKDITFWPMNEGDESKCKLNDLLAKFSRLERIPLLSDKGLVTYLLYKAMVNQFIGKIAMDPARLNNIRIQDLTLKDMLDSAPKLKDLFKTSFGFVAETATLADAKEKMEEINKKTPCNDIFVTKTGRSDEPLLGWVTDNVIVENLQIH